MWRLAFISWHIKNKHGWLGSERLMLNIPFLNKIFKKKRLLPMFSLTNNNAGHIGERHDQWDVLVEKRHC